MIQFANPYTLWILAAFPVLAGFALITRMRTRRRLREWGGEDRVARIARVPGGEWDLLAAVFLWGALALTLLALSRPQWGEAVETVKKVGISVVITVDTSRSMLVEDMVPNRLERSRLEIRSLLEADQNDRFALVAFAGVPVTLSPMTEDGAAVSMLLDIADAELVPLLGTDLAKALDEALSLLPTGGEHDKVILLLSDGEDQVGNAVVAAREAQRLGVRIFCVGAGTTEGGVVPGPEGAVFIDPDTGRPAVSRLEEDLLKQLAAITDGRYWTLGDRGSMVPKIIEELGNLKRREYASRSRITRQDHYAFFLIPAALLLLGYLAVPGRRLRFP